MRFARLQEAATPMFKLGPILLERTDYQDITVFDLVVSVGLLVLIVEFDRQHVLMGLRWG